MSSPLVRIGTRASRLAQWQANWVAEQLRQLGARVEIIEITTSGDVQQHGPIAGLGLQGVFTKEIQSAVLEGRADVAVHSLKDLPTEPTAGLLLAAVPKREVVADALVTKSAHSLADLPTGARVGTGSLRRQAQLKHLRSDLVVVGIRGNVDTRIRKLDDGECDAVVLAVAGLNRLGLSDRIVELLGPPRMLPAPGQGALGLECREDAGLVRELLGQLSDAPSRLSVEAERAMLAELHGGCSAPVGAWGRIEDDELVLDGLVADLAGTQVFRATSHGRAADAVSVGRDAAKQLLAMGAGKIIAETKQ